MSPIVVIPSNVLLALGNSATESLSSVLDGHATIKDAWENADTIAELVTDEPTKRQVIREFIESEAKRQGVPTSGAAQELLAAAQQQKDLNAETGKETERQILQQRLTASLQNRDFPKTPKEQREWNRENADVRHEIQLEFGADALLEMEREAESRLSA